MPSFEEIIENLTTGSVSAHTIEGSINRHVRRMERGQKVCMLILCAAVVFLIIGPMCSGKSRQ